MLPRLSCWFKRPADKRRLPNSGRRPHFCPRLDGLEERVTPTAGELDPSFGRGGIVTTPFQVPSDDSGKAVVLDSQGRIVVAGSTSKGNNSDFAVVRYTPDGQLDTTFGSAGIVTIAFGPSTDNGYGVAMDSTDRVIVACYTYNGSNGDFAVARLTTAGVLDPTFDGDGKKTIGGFR